jgi:hypothetical protein
MLTFLSQVPDLTLFNPCARSARAFISSDFYPQLPISTRWGDVAGREAPKLLTVLALEPISLPAFPTSLRPGMSTFPAEPIDLTLLTLRFQPHPRHPRDPRSKTRSCPFVSLRGPSFVTAFTFFTMQVLAFTIFTPKKPSTLNPQPKFQSTFHHQSPVFTTCLHFFTYSHTAFRFPVIPASPFTKNTSVYIKTHSATNYFRALTPSIPRLPDRECGGTLIAPIDHYKPNLGADHGTERVRGSFGLNVFYAADSLLFPSQRLRNFCVKNSRLAFRIPPQKPIAPKPFCSRVRGPCRIKS